MGRLFLYVHLFDAIILILTEYIIKWITGWWVNLFKIEIHLTLTDMKKVQLVFASHRSTECRLWMWSVFHSPCMECSSVY